MDILTNVESELRKRALAHFARQLDEALAHVRPVISANAGQLFHRVPLDIEEDIRVFRELIIAKLGKKVEDAAVRQGADIMFRALGSGK